MRCEHSFHVQYVVACLYTCTYSVFMYIHMYVQSNSFGEYLVGYTKYVLCIAIILTTMPIIVRIKGFRISPITENDHTGQHLVNKLTGLYV